MTDTFQVLTSTEQEYKSIDMGAAVVSGDIQPAVTPSRSYTSPDNVKVLTGFFTLEPGVLRTEVSATETIYVLEGEVEIAFDSGETVDLRQGDVLVLPAGAVTTRTVKSSYKEFYVHAALG